MLLHNTEELDDDLGAGSDHALSLACLLGVVDRLERIVENGSLDHVGGIGWIRKGRFGRRIESRRFSSRCDEDLGCLRVICVSLQKPQAGRVPSKGFFSSCRKK